jgi:hypothetical protein
LALVRGGYAQLVALIMGILVGALVIVTQGSRWDVSAALGAIVFLLLSVIAQRARK